jgi:hypothetical protein
MTTLNNAVARFDLSGRAGADFREHHKNWKIRVHDLINEPKSSNLGAFIYIILMGLVLLSSIVLCLGTLPEFKDNDEIMSIEWACAIAFSIELILRIVSWQNSWYTMLYSGTLYVDVLSVVPFFMVQGIEMSNPVDEVSSGLIGEEKNNGMQIIGILRLLRLLRLLKLVRHYEGSAVLAHALERSFSALLVPLFFLGLMCICMAGIIYYVEGMLYENEDFDNIFKAAWFVIVTLSTVGYGDISPVSPLGKFLTVPIIVAGLLFMAMPISIVGNNFTVIWEERQVLFVVAKIRSMLEDRNLTPEHLKQVFVEMDVDGDSSLDMQEFRRALGVMGITVTSRQLSETFQAFDGDMDGTVNYAEFCERVFPEQNTKSTVEKIHDMFHGEGSKKGATAAGEQPGVDAEESDETSKEPAIGLPISVYEISRIARDASNKLHESRRTLADRFALGAPQRLDVLEENLSRIAGHLGVDLIKYYDGMPQIEVDARVKPGARAPLVKRASTSIGLTKGLSATPIGHM